MDKKNLGKVAKVLALTVATFGIYGAYWAMSQSTKESEVTDNEGEKNANDLDRAAASALLMRHDLH